MLELLFWRFGFTQTSCYNNSLPLGRHPPATQSVLFPEIGRHTTNKITTDHSPVSRWREEGDDVGGISCLDKGEERSSIARTSARLAATLEQDGWTA